MPRKRSEKAAQSRASIQSAVEAFKNGEFKSVWATAKAFNVSETTLRARINGRVTEVEDNESRQLLSNAEETMLAKRCTYLTKTGFPPRKTTIIEMATEIQQRRVRKINDEEGMELVRYPPIGKDWIRRFLNRHPELRVKRPRRIDASRVKEVTHENVIEWIRTVGEVMRDYKIKPENVYNMDETGFSIGSIQAAHVVIDDTIKAQFQAQPGRQEWVTVLECICGDGSAVAPLVIFKAENGSTSWAQSPKIPGNWRFSGSQNGWTSNRHGVAWLRQCFDPDTRDKADGNYRLLILDGHGSHVTGSFIMHCMDYRIALMRLPPHTSHVLQPLDVGLFGPLKTTLSTHQDTLFRLHVARIRKVEWLIAYVKARATAFRPDNIIGGWRKAGLIPLNAQRVLQELDLPKTPPPSEPEPQLLPISTPDNVKAFETSLIDSSPPDATELKRINTAFRRRLGLDTPLKTPERGYAFRLSVTTEKLRAQVSLLQHENTELKRLNAQRKEQTKGTRVALKDRLLLTAEELRETVHAMKQEEEEKEKRKAAKPRKPRKRKAHEMEDPTEDQVDSANNDIQP